MSKLIAFFKTISLGVFIATLLYVYAMLPSQVFVFQEEAGPFLVSKNSFFYFALGMFFIINVLIYTASYFLKRVFTANAMSIILNTWLNGFSLFINLFFSLSVAALWAVNNSIIGFSVKLLFYGGLSMVILWIFALYFLIKRATKPLHQ